jgi:hypothetical protein
MWTFVVMCYMNAATHVCFFSQIYVPLDFESRYVVSHAGHIETEMGCVVYALRSIFFSACYVL